MDFTTSFSKISRTLAFLGLAQKLVLGFAFAEPNVFAHRAKTSFQLDDCSLVVDESDGGGGGTLAFFTRRLSFAGAGFGTTVTAGRAGA
jgi:hypothetical protein